MEIILILGPLLLVLISPGPVLTWESNLCPTFVTTIKLSLITQVKLRPGPIRRVFYRTDPIMRVNTEHISGGRAQTGLNLILDKENHSVFIPDNGGSVKSKK